MPAFYAHYRFGKCLLAASKKLEEALAGHRALFDIGLHGPDLYFFYHPVIPNKETRIGHEAHHHPGREFLVRGKKLFDAADMPEERAKIRAYLYGLMGHFLLDSFCHPYVAQAMETLHVTHAAVETAFDRFLLTADGTEPIGHDPCGHFVVNRENAAVIAPFFPPALVNETLKSLSSMVSIGRILHAGNPVFRAMLDKALYITFHHDAIADMIMTKDRDERCAQSDETLLGRFEAALARAPEFYAAVDRYLDEGVMPELMDFDRTFEG